MNELDTLLNSPVEIASHDPLGALLKLPIGDWSGLMWFIVIIVIGILLVPFLFALKKYLVTLIESKTETIAVPNQDHTKFIDDETIKFRIELANQMMAITQLIKDLKEEVILSKNPGLLDFEVDVIRIVHKHFDSMNKELLRFFYQRLVENHIDTNQDDISTNYHQFAQDLSGRFHGYLKHWIYKGRALSDFTSGDGAFRYCRYIVSELFALQVTAYEENKPVNLLQVSNGLARCTSTLLSQFREYLVSGDTFMEQWDDTKPMYKIISKLNDVEML